MGNRTGEDPYGDSKETLTSRGVAELLGLSPSDEAERVSLQDDEFAQVEAIRTAPTLIDEPTEYKAHCEECGTGIEWSGRGRKPRFCPDHKARTSGAAKGSSNRGTSRRSSKREAELEQLAYDLAKEIAMFGKVTSRALPVFGVTCVKRANNAAEVCKFYAGKYPAVYDALTTVAQVGPAIEAGEIVAELATALLVDAGRMSPDAMFAQMLGVYATYCEVYPDSVPDDSTVTGAGFAQANGHLAPQFIPVPVN